MHDEISKALGLNPMPKQEVLPPTKVVNEGPKDSEKDYKYARENFYDIIEKGTKALEDIIDVAHASQHPRAYEVVSTLIKTLVDANKDLVTLSNKQEEAGGEKVQTKNVTNNTMFVGSTHELHKLLKSMKNDEGRE